MYGYDGGDDDDDDDDDENIHLQVALLLKCGISRQADQNMGKHCILQEFHHYQQQHLITSQQETIGKAGDLEKE